MLTGFKLCKTQWFMSAYWCCRDIRMNWLWFWLQVMMLTCFKLCEAHWFFPITWRRWRRSYLLLWRSLSWSNLLRMMVLSSFELCKTQWFLWSSWSYLLRYLMYWLTMCCHLRHWRCMLIKMILCFKLCKGQGVKRLQIWHIYNKYYFLI